MFVQILLDTHAFIWWVLGDASLSNLARAEIGDSNNHCFVSAASAWEVTTKYRLGRLPQAAPLAADFPGMVVQQGFIPLALTLVHATRSGAFAQAHKDPFDRMIAAQAIVEGMPVVSIDAQLDQFGIRRIW
jgi:PIN domain nuclease of toxin-antitoxin system